MFSNLQLVLSEKGISIRQYAEFLEIDTQSAYDKIHSRSDFTYAEVRKTCTQLLPEYSVGYLFSESPLQPNQSHVRRRLKLGRVKASRQQRAKIYLRRLLTLPSRRHRPPTGRRKRPLVASLHPARQKKGKPGKTA